MKARRTLPFAILFVMVVSGCGKHDTAKVSGEVKLDDKPLEKGTIVFSPKEGDGQAASGEIANGKFSVAGVPVGPVKIDIKANKPGAKKKPYGEGSEEVDTWANVTFKAKGSLEADIKAGDNQLPAFELKTYEPRGTVK